MSQSAATVARAIARPARASGPARPPLQLVSPMPRRRSNLPFVLFCSFVLAAGLMAVLWLNMALSAGSYEMHDLEARASLASDKEGALREQLAVESSGGRLAERAGKLGMVPAGTPIFLRLPDGKVFGVAPKEPVKDPLTVVSDSRGTSTGAGTAATTGSPVTPSAPAAGTPQGPAGQTRPRAAQQPAASPQDPQQQPQPGQPAGR